MSVTTQREEFHVGSEDVRALPGLGLAFFGVTVGRGLAAGANDEGELRTGLRLAGEDGTGTELEIVRMRPEGQQPVWLRRGTQSKLRRNGR